MALATGQRRIQKPSVRDDADHADLLVERLGVGVELAYAIDNGAVGATCNPVIVLTVVREEMSRWLPRLRQLVNENPTATEDEVGWLLVEEVSKSAAKLLVPIFEQAKGRNGRLSIQTDPRYYRDTEAILAQAVHFNELADNMIVKIPGYRRRYPGH